MANAGEICNSKLDKVYSIVLRDLSSSDGTSANLHPKCLWVDHPQRENGAPKRGRQGELYTKTMVTGERYDDVTVKFKTPKDIIPNVNADSCKQVIGQIKNIVNKMPAGIWFHKAGDDACGKNALYNHWHILVSPLGNSPLTDCSSWRSLVTASGKTQNEKSRNMDVYCTELNSVVDMIYYLTIAPRQFIGSNNKQMLALVKMLKNRRETTQEAAKGFDEVKGTETDNYSVFDEDVDDFAQLCGITNVWDKNQQSTELSDDPFADVSCDTFEFAVAAKRPASLQVQRPSKRVKDTHYLETQLNETNTDNFVDLLKTADEQEKPVIKAIQASVHGDQALKTARSWISVEQRKTALETLLDMKETKGRTLSKDDSYLIMKEWESHLDCKPMSFWLKMYLILGCYLPKINMLVLEGVSNAGKSFFTEAWLKMTNLKVGEVVNDDRFMWANLVSSDVGICNELMLDPGNIQVLKKLGEGQKTKVAVKGKASTEVDRIPIIMTTNHPVWKLALPEKRPILNRCFYFKIRDQVPFMENIKAPLHPGAVIEVMKDIRVSLERNDTLPAELINDQVIDEILNEMYWKNPDFLTKQYNRIMYDNGTGEEPDVEEIVYV